MREITILIPLLRDGDRLPHDCDRIEQFENMLIDLAGGFSKESATITGCWESDDGRMIRDESRRYVVAVMPELVEDLRHLAKVGCELFDQQCIYFAETGTAELIGA